MRPTFILIISRFISLDIGYVEQAN